MSDLREIEVHLERRYLIDVEEWFTEYADEWLEYLDGDEPTDKLRDEFISDTAYEIGVDDLYDQALARDEDGDFHIDVAAKGKRFWFKDVAA